MPSNNLYYYLKQVQRRASLTVSSAWPSSPTDIEQLVLDSINERLRWYNNKYHLIFKQTEYTLTTTAGVYKYDLKASPYSLTNFEIDRLALNGIIRTNDGIPLEYTQYDALDWRKPVAAGNGIPTLYSTYGNELIIYPKPQGQDLTVRYHGTHIGTDSTGTTLKKNLTDETDLTMLEDQWQDVLITGAAASARGVYNADKKYQVLKLKAAEWENTLNDMGGQPGEDAVPALVPDSYRYGRRSAAVTRRYPPFGTPFSGGV